MNHYLINFNKNDLDKPWVITQVADDGSTVVVTWLVCDFETNTQAKSFVGQYHYISCRGYLSWDREKAIVNNDTTFTE